MTFESMVVNTQKVICNRGIKTCFYGGLSQLCIILIKMMAMTFLYIEKTILMSGQSIGFGKEIRKFCQNNVLSMLIWSPETLIIRTGMRQMFPARWTPSKVFMLHAPSHTITDRQQK